MRQVPPTVWLWLAATTLTALLMLAIRWLRGDSEAVEWIVAGIAVSLATLLASRTTVALARATDKPLYRLAIETSIRLSIPLSVLLGLAVVKRELLTAEFFVYFLPFQFVTIFADTAGSVWRINTGTGNGSS